MHHHNFRHTPITVAELIEQLERIPACDIEHDMLRRELSNTPWMDKFLASHNLQLGFEALDRLESIYFLLAQHLRCKTGGSFDLMDKVFEKLEQTMLVMCLDERLLNQN